MGRICRICGRDRPNERFGGRGRRAIVCSRCRQLPKEAQRRELVLNEIHGFLGQSNISKKNVKRLTQLESDSIPDVAELASLVKKIALVKSGKRKRWKWLWRRAPDLARSAREAGLFGFVTPADGPFEDDDESFPEYDSLDDRLSAGHCFGVWIEPRPHEHEPSCSWLFRDGTG